MSPLWVVRARALVAGGERYYQHLLAYAWRLHGINFVSWSGELSKGQLRMPATHPMGGENHDDSSRH
jgi:hypothetical protein